jgi:hypothetical protein
MKTKSIKIFSFLLMVNLQFACSLSKRVVDRDRTMFIVKIPKEFQISGATVSFKIGKEIKWTATNLSDSVKFMALKKDDVSKIEISYSDIGYSNENWVGNFKLIGSNIVYADLLKNGTIILKQWPLVEFESTDPLTDVEFDGEIIGPRSVSTTVKPNIDHIVKWKKGNVIKCQTTLNLTYNQSRKYTCNSNGSLTEN